MSPLKHSNHFAARMGRWSASHWKTAVFGWLAFVVASSSSASGRHQVPQDHRRQRRRVRARPTRSSTPASTSRRTSRASSSSSSPRRSTPHDPAFRATIKDVTRTLGRSRRSRRSSRRSPRATRDQISTDGHSAMVTFVPKGDYDQAAPYIDNITQAVDKVAGPASRLLRRGDRQRLDREEVQRHLRQPAREGRPDRPPAHAGHPAVRLRLRGRGARAAAAGAHRRHGHDRARRAPEPAHPGRRADRRGDPPDRPRGRHRLLALLRPPRARRARPPGAARAPPSRPPRPRPAAAVLVSGFTVMIAMAGMFFSGDKTFMSFSVGTMMVVFVAMIGSLTVLPALLCRLGDRIEKGRIPFLHRLRARRRRGPLLERLLDRVLRRPVLSAVAAGAVLVALAIPALSSSTRPDQHEGSSTSPRCAAHQVRELLPAAATTRPASRSRPTTSTLPASRPRSPT